jgi:asparagine synthase (glutamine-hydrolysing)
VDRHQSGQSDFSAPLWTLMMFEAFLRQVVDAPESIGLPVPEAVA